MAYIVKLISFWINPNPDIIRLSGQKENILLIVFYLRFRFCTTQSRQASISFIAILSPLNHLSGYFFAHHRHSCHCLSLSQLVQAFLSLSQLVQAFLSLSKLDSTCLSKAKNCERRCPYHLACSVQQLP